MIVLKLYVSIIFLIPDNPGPNQQKNSLSSRCHFLCFNFFTFYVPVFSRVVTKNEEDFDKFLESVKEKQLSLTTKGVCFMPD